MAKGGLILANRSNRIREIRKSKKLTLADISVSTGFSIAYLSYIERGNRPGSHGSLQLIADALGVTVADLEVA
jgi:transcriptional regulator with XRE-family HTH domain